MTEGKEKKESRSEAETAAARKKGANEQNSVSTDNKRISESNPSKDNAMTEGGRTIAAPNEQVAHQQSAHSRKENFVLHLNVSVAGDAYFAPAFQMPRK
jgi:hypothetical protein